MKSVLALLLLLVAIVVPTLLYATQIERQSLEARVAAFKHENGDVEFAIQVKDADGWGERLLPRIRTVNDNSAAGRWLASSSVSVDLPSKPESESELTAALLETSDSSYHFSDVAVVWEGDDIITLEATVDGVEHRWANVWNNQSVYVYAFPETGEFDEESLKWIDYEYVGVVIQIGIQERGHVLSITPKLDRAGSFYAHTPFVRPSSFRLTMDQFKREGRYDLPDFSVDPSLSQQNRRQTPCTSADIWRMPNSHDWGVVGYAFNPVSCGILTTRTLRVDSSGDLYGVSGGRGICRYSVAIEKLTTDFARATYTFDQDCELRLVGGGNSEMYYLVGDYWEVPAN